MARLLRRLASAAVTLVIVWALLVALIGWRQEWLIFRPHTLPADWVFDKGVDVHERWIEVDGGRLNALHLKLPSPDGVVFFLHGNGGSLEGWFGSLDLYRRANLDLFMIDYRGYGKSPCCITSEAQLHADVRAAWQAIAPAYAGKARVFYGRSLGTGLAAVLAAEVQPELTILGSPYFSMAALAEEHYPWVPRAVLRYPLSTADALSRVATPVLMLHGTEDKLIDVSHARRLKALRPQTTLVEIDGAAHNDVARHGPYRAAVAAALERVANDARDARAARAAGASTR
jgi:pimeloyl-ACP methyl ester carboxylesterase